MLSNHFKIFNYWSRLRIMHAIAAIANHLKEYFL